MRKIKRIVIHCTDTSPKAKIKDIENYWRNVKGWDYPGYHVLIDEDGTTHQLLGFNGIANGARGYNSNSIHIGYIGRRPNEKQLEALREEIDEIRAVYFKSNLEVVGHRDLPDVKKTCPNFDVQGWYYGRMFR